MKTFSLILATLCLAASQALAGTAGFTMLRVQDGPNPPLTVGVWYPAAGVPRPTEVGAFVQSVVPDAAPVGQRLPLVVMSHGNGGDFAGHSDLALALAQAGFVVAAPTHTGDNYRDQSRALDVAGRARQIRSVIDYMLAVWGKTVLDPARVGAFGFSSGGLSVLIAAGGAPDLSRLGPHCAAHPTFFDCRLMAQHKPADGLHGAADSAFPHDPRIRAIVVAAPALGFAFDAARLAHVTRPVQLWEAEDDVVLPPPFYAEMVRHALPRPPEFHAVPHAGHFDFLAPCSAILLHAAPAICVSESGFDRAKFHEAMNAVVIAFFNRAIRA
jgi:predicted dienelactone hydrolase